MTEERLLRYVFEKEKARYIGGNMAGTTPEELASEFRAIAKRNSKVQIPVAHISFSPSPSEHLDDLQALEFAQAYMDKIGFGENQWVLAGHSDTNRTYATVTRDRASSCRPRTWLAGNA